MKKLLADYFELQKKLHEYFGYTEDWRIIPLDDATDYFWKLEGEEHGGEVYFANSIDQLEDRDAGDLYVHSIYTQRHLPKWVYRGDGYTMICVDTHTDGNKLLQVFDNTKQQF